MLKVGAAVWRKKTIGQFEELMEKSCKEAVFLRPTAAAPRRAAWYVHVLPLALASTLALLRVCFMSSPVCFAGHCHVRIRGRGSSGCRYMMPRGHSAASDSWNLLRRCRIRHHRLCYSAIVGFIPGVAVRVAVGCGVAVYCCSGQREKRTWFIS